MTLDKQRCLICESQGKKTDVDCTEFAMRRHYGQHIRSKDATLPLEKAFIHIDNVLPNASHEQEGLVR